MFAFCITFGITVHVSAATEQYIGSIGGNFGIPETEANVKDWEDTWYVITSEYERGIAVRAEASQEAELFCRIPYGTTFLVDEIDGVWGHTTVNGYTGWIHLDYAQEVDMEEETGWYRITSDYSEGIAVRAEASQKSELFCRIPYGTTFFVNEVDGVWGHTVVNGYEGWIHLDYAEKI